MTTKPDAWDGKPPASARNGWHWLRRRADGGARMAFWRVGSGWLVADFIGRTSWRRESLVARLYVYVAPIEEPDL